MRTDYQQEIADLKEQISILKKNGKNCLILWRGWHENWYNTDLFTEDSLPGDLCRKWEKLFSE